MIMEKKKKIRFFLSIALSTLGTLFFFWAAACCSGLEPLSESIFGLYDTKEHAPAAEEIFERQKKGSMGLSVTWWNKKGKERIKSSETGRTTEAEILALCGRSDRLFPGSLVLDYDQTSYCLLGKGAAEALFGSCEAEGLLVEYGDSIYQVKDVLPEAEDAFLYEAGKEESLTFSRLTAACDYRNGQAIIKNKVQALCAPDGFLDYSFLLFLAELFLMLIPAAGGCRLFRLYWKRGRGQQGGKKLFLQAGGCLVLIMLAGFMHFYIHVPVDFFPPKWSDFTFWTELWKEKQAAVRLILEMDLALPDLIFLLSFGKTVFLNICSILCFAWAGRLKKTG